MRFSIIIPVYNVEKYIRKCMDTVMNQTFRDYEVVVVNDETPDGSMEIVQEYVQAYPGMIQVIHQKNTRQGGARNNGVTKARGEYLLFVDSDDYVAPTMLETVDARLKEHPCDVLVFQNVPVTEQGEIIAEADNSVLAPGAYDPKKNPEVVMIPTGPTNKAFRRDFYLDTQMTFPEKLLYEDAITRLLYAMAGSVVICDDVLYYYVQSSNSSMRRSISEKMLDILAVTDIVIQEFRKHGKYEQFRAPLDCALIYGILHVLDYINSEQPDHPIQIPMSDYVKTRFPDYRENPCIGKTLCRALDYLVDRKFRKYHYRILVSARIKEGILALPVFVKLNDLRRRQLC